MVNKFINMLIFMLRTFLIFTISLIVLLIQGCTSSFGNHSYLMEPLQKHQQYYNRSMFIQSYVDSMADALVVNSQGSLKKGRIAVGTITRIDTFQLESSQGHPLHYLGLQLQESLMTAFLQRGYRVVEYRRANNIIIKAEQDQMLSRSIEDLKQQQDFHYFLTGTIKYQENGAAINLRIIDLANNEVNSASTKFIPKDVFWDQRRVNMVNGHLYRG